MKPYYQDAKSFNGRTTGFEPENGGSIPSLATSSQMVMELR